MVIIALTITVGFMVFVLYLINSKKVEPYRSRPGVPADMTKAQLDPEDRDTPPKAEPNVSTPESSQA